MHGGAPRVRRRRNGETQTGATIEINPDLMASLIISSAVGAIAGNLATRWME